MRGRMLESVLVLLMMGSAQDQRDYIRFEAKSHLSYGVLPHMYENLLGAVHDTVRTCSAPIGPARWRPRGWRASTPFCGRSKPAGSPRC